MSPRQQRTSRKHTNEGNADSAVEHRAPLTISTGQIPPANQQHKSNPLGAPVELEIIFEVAG